ncbi:MAG: hypothetical protein ABIR17_04530 [Pseudolysinimonas sp.]
MTPGDLPNRLGDDDSDKATHPETPGDPEETDPVLTDDFDKLISDDFKKMAGIEQGDPPESGPGGNPFLQQNL